MNIKKVLLTLLLIHVLAFILTACGSKRNNATTPNDCIRDQYGYCQGPIYGNVQNFPFYPNASISNRDGFKRFMNSEFGVYARCHDFFSADCRGLQVLVQNAGGNSYNIILRGLAVNGGRNLYFGNSYFNYEMQNNAASVNFHATAQAYKSGSKTIVRLQKATFNVHNPFPHADMEHSLNHVYLETDGLLSQGTIRFILYYNSGRSGGVAVPIASGTLVKGRDIL